MSENERRLAPTEVDEVQNETSGEEVYDIDLSTGQLRVAESKSGLSRGKKFYPGDRAQVTVEAREGLYIRNISDSTAVYELKEVES